MSAPHPAPPGGAGGASSVVPTAMPRDVAAGGAVTGASAPLRVALDVSATRLAQTGVARVARALERALQARDDVTVLTVGEGSPMPPGSWRKRALALHLDLLWSPLLGPRAAAAAGAQLYHCPSPRAPLTRGRLPVVVSVHDLTVLLSPRTMSRWNAFYSRATLRRVLATADRIIAGSADTANDLDRLLGVDGARVRVVPHGVDNAFFGAPAGPPRVEGPYVLFVGTPEPRKNLPRLVEAMGQLRAHGRAERLVVVGSAGWGGEQVGREEHVLVLGRVNDAVLRALYAHASCLALPSLHEGFGLPALEAMAAGCPVVAARAGALPEVCGNAAVLVDPLSVQSIASGIEVAIDDGESLRRRGRARASEHGWELAAASLAAVYRELT
jgi:glycosyltransferase involved in cell wall biosynthesis